MDEQRCSDRYRIQVSRTLNQAASGICRIASTVGASSKDVRTKQLADVYKCKRRKCCATWLASAPCILEVWRISNPNLDNRCDVHWSVDCSYVRSEDGAVGFVAVNLQMSFVSICDFATIEEIVQQWLTLELRLSDVPLCSTKAF